jgi:hypothetical protein
MTEVKSSLWLSDVPEQFFRDNVDLLHVTDVKENHLYGNVFYLSGFLLGKVFMSSENFTMGPE